MFSREKQKTQALGVLIRHAKQLAKNQDPEYKLKHNDECREALQSNYTKLVARITKEFNDNYDNMMKYRETHWK